MYLRKGNKQSLVSFITRPSLTKAEMNKINGGKTLITERHTFFKGGGGTWSVKCDGSGTGLSEMGYICDGKYSLSVSCSNGAYLR